MEELGRRGILGLMKVKVAFEHKGQGRKYSIGETVEGQLVEHQGKVVFEFVDQDNPDFIDPEKIDPVNLDRKEGIRCMWSIANDCSGNQDDREWYYDKGTYLDGKLIEHNGGVFFTTDGLILRLDLFTDDWETLEYEGGLGYEIEEVPRFFNALG
jgi:hypothetical protein